MRVSKNRHKIIERPVFKRSGDIAYLYPRQLLAKGDEISVSMLFVSDRSLFGLVYAGLQPNYFYRMPKESGVFVSIAISTKLLECSSCNPGDIDILVIPYERNELILDRILAIEVKVVRASFVRQGKSPNDFGFTQAAGLRSMGFPYVAVAHLIVSDDSPRHAWREMGVARVLDRQGNVEILNSLEVDCLPIDLMKRSFGRLCAVAKDDDIGLVAAYPKSPFRSSASASTAWHPDVRRSKRNRQSNLFITHRVAAIFDRFPQYFLDNPRW